MSVYMKRLLIIIVILVVVAVACIEVFIPATLHVSSVAPVGSRAVAVFGVLRSADRWAGWWPGDSADSGFRYRGIEYRLQTLSYHYVGCRH